jgi:hypothetical protein
MNGGKMKNNDDCVIEYNDKLNYKNLMRSAIKKFGGNHNYNNAKIYNKKGVLLFEEDLCLVAPNDVLYIAL